MNAGASAGGPDVVPERSPALAECKEGYFFAKGSKTRAYFADLGLAVSAIVFIPKNRNITIPF